MKKRADILLVEKGLAATRQKAQAMIMSGEVRASGETVQMASMLIDEDTVFEVAQGLRYVSRGGLKLEKAILVFDIDLTGSVCIDIGASTGGFTDCMLQNHAAKVYAVDVGYGQLDWSLRNNPDVVVMERTNARNLEKDMFDDRIDFISVDVSFISLNLIFPAMKKCLSDNGTALTLIKPQFEAGKGKVGKNGVVRNKQVHVDVLSRVIGEGTDLGFQLTGLDYSPITGPKGNIEFLAYWRNGSGASKASFDESLYLKTVEAAYAFHHVNFE